MDLYFPEYKIVVECDEGHSNYKPEKEKERMEYINLSLGIDNGYWIRYNPDEKDFDISKVIGQIYILMGVKGKILTRQCATCKIEKQLTEFHESKHQPLGREYSCKDCRCVLNKEKLAKKRKNLIIPDIKLCTMCDTEKPSNNFWKSIGYKDGLYKFCKTCGKQFRKKQQENFPKVSLSIKKCNKCNKIQSVTNFGLLKASSDGYQYKCKSCT